jgi:hypothetical protein
MDHWSSDLIDHFEMTTPNTSVWVANWRIEGNAFRCLILVTGGASQVRRAFGACEPEMPAIMSRNSAFYRRPMQQTWFDPSLNSRSRLSGAGRGQR